jgi:5-methylcytosine-specific restriction enzyme subunit McrC
MNVRYQSAHLWSGLLLNGGGVNDMLVDGSWNAGTLLINMNVLWERVVQRLCRDLRDPRSTTGRGSIAIVVHEQGRATRRFIPDAVLVGHDGSDMMQVPVDAKYKDYGSKPLDRNDAHQLLTYASAFHRSGADPEALVVHPVVGRAEVRAVEVRAAGRMLGKITLIGIESGGSVEQSIAGLRLTASSIAAAR